MVRVLIRKPLSIGAKARCDEVPTSRIGDKLPLVSQQNLPFSCLMCVVHAHNFHQPSFPRPPNPFFELEPTIVNLSAIYPLSTDFFLDVHASRSFHSQIKSSSSNSKSRFMEIPKISAVPKQATSRGDGERCYTTCQFTVIWVVCAYASKILPL